MGPGIDRQRQHCELLIVFLYDIVSLTTLQLAALFQHVTIAEREQADIEQNLKLVEEQQKELASTLEVYEKAAGEIFEGQGGGLRALDVGPADAERDKQ